MRDHAEFVLDALKYVETVKLSVYQLHQAAVKLLGATNHTSCHVQHSL